MVLTFIVKYTDFKSDDHYQFIFSKDENIMYGEHWNTVHGEDYGITPPPLSEIISVYELVVNQNIDFELELLQEGDEHPYLDGVEGTTSIATEIDPPISRKRLNFYFGDKLEDIKNKLYSRDFSINEVYNNAPTFVENSEIDE